MFTVLITCPRPELSQAADFFAVVLRGFFRISFPEYQAGLFVHEISARYLPETY